MIEKRARLIKTGENLDGPVVYWMSRDQRCFDNWALLFAQENAKQRGKHLLVVFHLEQNNLEATSKIKKFMIDGLHETNTHLSAKNIPLVILIGEPSIELPIFIKEIRASLLVTDFNPLRHKQIQILAVMRQITIPFYEVDTHNIIPCWVASTKQEYGAYTLRKKINQQLPYYLESFPTLSLQEKASSDILPKINWDEIYKKITGELKDQHSLKNPAGTTEGNKKLNNFIQSHLEHYNQRRNDPTLSAQSGLSPYLHFGQISAQRVALEVLSSHTLKSAQESFLEELIIRRELADNFCYYNQNYDNIRGFPAWAQETLHKHKYDSRPYIYQLDQLESGNTHDNAWNAAQRQLTRTGIMHGYMRMYWAKKILEWSITPNIAQKNAIYLNDHYSMDGRDPNGYAGIAWSIGGVHDRAWSERLIFGKIRYMNFAGLRRKFDIEKYIKQQIIANGVSEQSS